MPAAFNKSWKSSFSGYYSGAGRIGGLPPDPSAPDSPDGRLRIQNVPASRRITVHDRGSMAVVASTRSAADGTWTVTNLNPNVDFVVIGWDDTGTYNAAIQDWVRPAVP